MSKLGRKPKPKCPDLLPQLTNHVACTWCTKYAAASTEKERAKWKRKGCTGPVPADPDSPGSPSPAKAAQMPTRPVSPVKEHDGVMLLLSQSSKSGYKGVFLYQKNGLWAAQGPCLPGGGTNHLGFFESAPEAAAVVARAYAAAANKIPPQPATPHP